jgi:hypothetical protein
VVLEPTYDTPPLSINQSINHLLPTTTRQQKVQVEYKHNNKKEKQKELNKH